ncbi:MAG: leucine-rich repeat protein [Bacillota bacterium]|nr:leucine-rich repeat protein [Bacillota bacterium]
MKKLVSFFLVLALIIFHVDTIKAFADTQSGDFMYTVSGGTAAITGYTGSGGIVVIPSNIDGYIVTDISDLAFYGCSSITSITISNSVTRIGTYTFYGCSSLTSITIPNSVTTICDFAFYGCSSLASIAIPSSVTNINSYAFCGCSKLCKINVNDTNPNYSSLDGVLYNKNKTTLRGYPAGKTDSNFTIPSSVTRINDFAFYGCSSLTSITIPNSVTEIGYEAFYGCSTLTSITIPNSVTTIDDSSFYGCTKLSQINVNDDNPNYSNVDGVLYNKLKTTLINYPVGKANSNFIIPNSITSIGNDAFYGCSSLTSITIPNSVTCICGDAFYGCTSLTSITIPNSVTYIGLMAFYDCFSLTSITIPNSISSIGTNTFYGCSSLTSITIPSSVTSICQDAFDNCQSTLTIYYHNTSIGFTNPWHEVKTVSCNIVSYNGNGNTSGTVPVDNNVYAPGSKASLLNNTGSLIKTGYVFSGWNTAADGSGTSYPANTSILMNGTDIKLYAQWKIQSISPSTGTFTKAAPNNLTTVITAPYKATNPVTGVYNGTTRLTCGTDQVISPTATGYTLILYKSYLSKLTSNTIITVKFKDGSSLNYNVVLGASLSPTTGTFTKAAPNNLTTVITAPNKAANPVTGVYNGTTRLICGTDQVITSTATGYTLTLYKSYLSKLTSNTVITVKFKDGSFLNYTVNVK